MKTSVSMSLIFHVVTLAAMILPFKLTAQNWEPVYFSEAANYTIAGADSETFFYLYPFAEEGETITGRFLPNLNAEVPCVSGGENPWSCTDSCKVATNPFLQEYAVFLPDGMVEFQNPDTFRIYCHAQVGEGWIFGTNVSGNEVFAEVTDQFEGTVLGIADSIKVITIDDGAIIHLSKHHGITFWSGAEHDYSLSSIPARNLGGSLLSKADVFDLAEGDVFVYLYHGENGYDEGFSNNYVGSRSIVRNDVVNVDEMQDTLFISLHTTVYIASYSNWNGNYTAQNDVDTMTRVLKIPLADDCLVYNWPIGGVRPSHMPAEIDEVLVGLLPIGLTCNSNFTYDEDCIETALGGNFQSETFNEFRTDQFDSHTLISTSMNLYGGTVLDANSNTLEVIDQDPREFYEWQDMARCEFQSGESTNSINIGDAFFDVAENDFFSVRRAYALGDGLGLVAYDYDYFGLGGYCRNRMVMVGFHKLGAEAQGFVPEAIDLITLSSSDVVARPAIHIYPNPTSTFVRLDLPGSTLTRATFYDMQGRQVLDVQLNASDSAIDVSTLPKGMYLLRAGGQNGAVYVNKLVVE